jgi:hypothetical protein
MPAPRAQAFERWAAAAVAYGCVTAALRLVVYVGGHDGTLHGATVAQILASPASSLLVGLVAAVPLLSTSTKAARSLWWTLMALLLAGVAAAAHYHLIFRTLPDTGVLHYLVDDTMKASLFATLPPWLLTLEVIVAMLATGMLGAGLERGFAARPVWSKAFVGFLVITGVASTLGALGGERVAAGRVDPWIWLLAERPEPVAVTQDAVELERAFAIVSDALEWPETLSLTAPHPLCGSPQSTQRPTRKRDIIMIVFEGLTSRELTLRHEGEPVLPAISAAFDQSVRIGPFYASAAQTSSVLESHYAGQPVNPHRIALQHPPVPHMEGFAESLARAGRATVYAHGANLSFENKRAFLRMVGFDELIEPPVDARFPDGAWGEEDGATYERLQRWIEEQRDTPGGYFAAMTTLSTHHPYVVPDDALRLAPDDSEWGRFINATHYMDSAFAEFHAWYLANEAPRGTLLVLLGEHVPRIAYPSDPTETTTGMFEFRFEIPFGVIGLDPDEQAAAHALGPRPGSHPDVGPTLLGLVGLPPPRCGVGRDLLDPVATVSPDRAVVSHAGHRPYFLYVHKGPVRWMWDYRAERLRAFDPAADPNLEHDLAPEHPDAPAILRLVRTYTLALGAVDQLGDRAPPSRGSAETAGRTARAAPPWPPVSYATLDTSRPGVSYGHGLLRWARDQSDPVRIEVRAALSRDRALVVSAGTRVSGGAGEDWIRRFDVAQLRTMVDVEVVTLTELAAALPDGSALLARIDQQPDARIDLEVPAALTAVSEAARARGVSLAVRSDAMNVASAAPLLADIPIWFVPASEMPVPDAVDFASGAGAHGVVLPAPALAEEADSLRAAGLAVALDGVDSGALDAARAVAPDIVILSR